MTRAADAGLPPQRLELEITESVLLRGQRRQSRRCCTSCRRSACPIALDDFGTGYSSLSYLQSFPFDKIKIDRSFVGESRHRADCAAIVCAVTGLARSLDITTTAEGVETAEQLALLRAAGCTQAQGYLFGQAAPQGRPRLRLGRSRPAGRLTRPLASPDVGAFATLARWRSLPPLPLASVDIASALLDVIVADITTLALDAIVNAANHHCSAAAASMARSIARRARSCWRNAARSAAATPATRRSRAATGCRRAS